MGIKEVRQLSVNKVKDKLVCELATKFQTAGKEKNSGRRITVGQLGDRNGEKGFDQDDTRNLS